MPVTMKRTKGGRVRVSTPGGVKAKAATPENAVKQRNLLNALEHNPDFRPRRKVH